jgi:hypothetical protein
MGEELECSGKTFKLWAWWVTDKETELDQSASSQASKYLQTSLTMTVTLALNITKSCCSAQSSKLMGFSFTLTQRLAP